MLTLARTPLAHLGTNTHYAMSANDDRAIASKRTTRRTSARPNDKDKENGAGANGFDDAIAVPSSAARSGTTRGGRPKQPAAKRKPEYDEDDGDFVFTRKKRLRTVPEPVVEEAAEEVTAQTHPVQPQKKRGRPRADERDEPVQNRERSLEQRAVPERRKEARPRPVDRDENEPAPIEVKKKRRTRAKTPDEDSVRAEEDARGRSRHVGPESKATPVATQAKTTTISLPFADTPVIRKNQAMRRGTQGSRRSSLSNRGRRASSLIDSGRSSALPHESVESTEFFKHIESGLPEPRRMKQLLTWCATRALSEENNDQVRNAAREIQRQILRDFGDRNNMWDWFQRDDSETVKDPGPAVKKPHPKNVANEAKIKELEQQLQRLKSERETWERLLKPATKNALLSPPPSQLPALNSIDSALLTDSNASILGKLRSLQLVPAPQLSQDTRTKLDTTTANLEFQTDQLADNVHILNQYRNTSEKLAGRVLNDAATALEVRSRKERERSGTEEVGVRDVLRGLSRVEQRQ